VSAGATAPRRADRATSRGDAGPATAAAPETAPSPAFGWAGLLALLALAVAVFFFCYWRQSRSVPVTSDGASNVLQAWAMLHGNLALHNWWVSDVSFYTTELPQYALIEAVLGLGPWVVNVAAAMTYTLLVLLAAVLARGGARGAAGLARALLAGGIMLAPQLGATPILLNAPDHIGTSVPLLAIWLIIDRARARWIVVVAVGLAFAWTMVGDSVILLTGIVPLILVCAVRAFPGRVRSGPRWFEASLAAAAAAAGVAGSFAPRIIAALGGYRERHVGTATDLGQLPHGAWITVQGLLELFGANVFTAGSAAGFVLALCHLVGVIAVACGLGVAATRFLGSADLLVPVFAVAIVLNAGAYLISTHARTVLGAREMAAVLPLGAVLAGRTLGEPVLAAVRARRWTRPALAVVSAGYLASLGYGAVQPSQLPADQPLAAWLAAHRLGDGLAGYWQANSTTLDSGRRVLLSAVTEDDHGRLVPYQWETDDADYDPARHYADFVVAGGPAGLPGIRAAATRTFGAPVRTYQADGYTILVWDANLLAKLG
jgi:hypothetical protein